MNNPNGINDLIAAAREMVNTQIGTMEDAQARGRFLALDHPDCPHGCIGGVVLLTEGPRPPMIGVGYWKPCPLHGEGSDDDR